MTTLAPNRPCTRSPRRSLLWLIGTLALLGGTAPEAQAQAKADKPALFEPYGDFRLRIEQDWDSRQGDGTELADRLRLRFRLRAGLIVNVTDRWSARVQVRSGPHDSQQSPHITIHDFDGGQSGPYEFNLDYWYASYRTETLEVWAGRNELSFLHQDDLFLIDNITFAGVGGSFRRELGKGALTLLANYVALPVGMWNFSGTSFIGQVAYQPERKRIPGAVHFRAEAECSRTPVLRRRR